MRQKARGQEPRSRVVLGKPGTAVREVSLHGKGLVKVRQSVRIAGSKAGVEASGPYWIMGWIHLREGRIHYGRGKTELAGPSTRMGIFFPPWAMVHTRVWRVHYESEAVLSRRSLPKGVPAEPVLFLPAPRALPDSVAGVGRTLRAAKHLQPIGHEGSPSPFAARIKAKIEHSYAEGRKISQIAEELRIAPAVLTRIFRRAYGMPPVRYRHFLRLLDGILRLAGGDAPVDVAAEVGFEDVGRFYSHFRAQSCGSPGQYRTRVKKRQAVARSV